MIENRNANFRSGDLAWLAAEIWLSFATILAIIAGPIIAVQIDKWLQRNREHRIRQHWIFRELMITRSTRLTVRHVEALNGVPMEFSEKDKKEKRMLDAWTLYMNHLNTPTGDDVAAWAARGFDRLTDLLYEMGVALAYNFPKANIQRDSYAPKYFAELENEQNELRKAALTVFRGDKPLKVETQAAPEPQLGPPRMRM